MVKTLHITVCSLAAASVLGCCASWAQEVHFNYGTVKPTYTQQKPDGSSTTQRDISSGQATGKRMHKPVTIVREAGPGMSPPGGGNPTAGKPLTTTVNPALQGNVLQKSGAGTIKISPEYTRSQAGGGKL